MHPMPVRVVRHGAVVPSLLLRAVAHQELVGMTAADNRGKSTSAMFKPERDIPAEANIAQRHQILALVDERDRLRDMLRTLAYDLIGWVNEESSDSKQVTAWALEVLELTA